MRTRVRGLLVAVWFISATIAGFSLQFEPATLAISGGTLIDGTGGPPIGDTVVLIEDGRITALGPRASIRVPDTARVIDAAGKYVLPGLIDTNVHLSLYGGTADRYETLARYHPRQQEIVLEAAQLQLSYGVTTVRDSYGVLPPLMAVRDAIAAGRAVGPRILAAGNIVGWGGPYSISFSLIREQALTLFQEQVNDEISQGVGEDLVDLDVDELRTAIRAYLDKGPDFLKYGGTAHFSRPAFIGFSPEAQKAIVEETHGRGRVAETHATTTDGLRLSIEAGIDLIQHPEVVGTRELPDTLVRAIVERKIVCSMLTNTITGDAWKKHLKDRDEAARKRGEKEKDEKKDKAPERRRTSAEVRQREAEEGVGMEMRRRNAQKLIKAGAVVTIGTDNYWAAAPELSRTPKPETQNHGIGSILAIEGLVELGMTPAQAIVAATKHGAIASRGLEQFGTIEKGKRADLLILDANPLDDIRNLRKLSVVLRDGRVLDRDKLPEQRVLSRAPVATSTYDLVIAGGRVVDPESGLDAVRTVGLSGGKIAAISSGPLTGRRVIEAAGLTVVPGFIDLHSHVQAPEVYGLQAADGVTTALELEVGAADIEGWYRERDAGQIINYGISVGHIPVRMVVLRDPGTFLPTGSGAHQTASASEIGDIARRIEDGLDRGAVGIGAGFAYTPAASRDELLTVFRVAARRHVAVHAHIRRGVAGLEEALALASETKASLHVVHLNSTGLAATRELLAMIAAARSRGLNVTTEAYPYSAGMTEIQSANLDEYEGASDERLAALEWPRTGERLTRETFRKYRLAGGPVVTHTNTDEMVAAAIVNPLTMIASDAYWENGIGHPRTTGTYSKVLGRYVRDGRSLTLMDAIRKMTLMPAQRLEDRVPAMKAKGRLRVGADADVTIFDAAKVIDRSTYREPAVPPDGIRYVIVGGVPVVAEGQAVKGVTPGRAVRAPVKQP